MNKERYKNAFSGVRPSDQCIERIVSMTDNKKKTLKKGWIVAIAAVLILACALFTVNAATDGAIFQSELFQGIIVRFNGAESRITDFEYTAERTTDSEGNEVVKYSFDLPNDGNVDVFVAEDYTALSLDSADLDSVQIYGDHTEDTEIN